MCLDLAKLIAAATRAFLVHILLAPAKIGAGMFAAEFHTSRHHIAIVAMACLCVLLGGPSYAAGAESLIIAGATYYEPGVSLPRAPGPERACAPMACICKMRALAMVRPAVVFPSTPRGLMRQVRWRGCVHGRIACVRAVCEACWRGLWC